MDHSNSAKKERPRYASLTAGLLARKGQAVPVAASFSPEAMAQHLPAKRLAQEFESESTMSGWNPFNALGGRSLDQSASEDELSAGPLDERASKIEEALSEEWGRSEAQKGPELDLFGDEVPEEQGDQGLGLDALVDRAIESAQRNRPGAPLDFEDDEFEYVDTAAPKSNCAAAKADLVASIRNASLAEQGNGAGVPLDPRRYIRLQVAAMKLDVTKQELMSAALDAFLDTLLEDTFSECSCMQKGLI
ncbi:MAG: hypothetical protein EP340_05905 [Alphaproteobacteria bacterium]|nr:MAG: hypothetical protein EP340_05905 [Alphaproteobacteria bacterium]